MWNSPITDPYAAALRDIVQPRKPRKDRKVTRCPTCLSRVDRHNPDDNNGGCAWCNGAGGWEEE